MPIGAYTVMDGDGRVVGTEEFRASSGPYGWRYVSTVTASDPELHGASVDLTADDTSRPVRVAIDTGVHHLLLAPEEDRLVGVRDGEPLDLPWQEHVDFFSPSFNACTAVRLAGTEELSVVYVDPESLALRLQRQRYEPLGPTEVNTPAGRFAAEGWRFTSLETAWTRRLWIAGPIVVAYEGLYELRSYEPGRTGPHPG